MLISIFLTYDCEFIQNTLHYILPHWNEESQDEHFCFYLSNCLLRKNTKDENLLKNEKNFISFFVKTFNFKIFTKDNNNVNYFLEDNEFLILKKLFSEYFERTKDSLSEKYTYLFNKHIAGFALSLSRDHSFDPTETEKQLLILTGWNDDKDINQMIDFLQKKNINLNAKYTELNNSSLLEFYFQAPNCTKLYGPLHELADEQAKKKRKLP